jgi:metal-responsive CopG/Arc/MetJ family transcriptional regulator
MGNVRISLPDELHRNLKRRAIDESVPLKELIERALREYMRQHPPRPSMFDLAMEKRETKEGG